MGPAGLVQALEQVKPMGLKHPLAGEQAARHAEAGVAEQGSGHQQQAESIKPAGGLEHQAGKHGAEEGAAHIPHEHLGRAPVPEQKSKQRPHQCTDGPRCGQFISRSGNGYGHAAGHEPIQAIHEVGEVDHGGDRNNQEGEDGQEEQTAGRNGKAESLDERAEAEDESGC